MSINFRNLQPQWVSQDKFNWNQNNHLQDDRELVNVYLYKAVNLTNNGLQIFADTTQQTTLLDIRISQSPEVIKMKPLIATGGLALKPTYETMLANIAFSNQPEFICWDDKVQILNGNRTVKAQAVSGNIGAEQAVGNDLYFIRLETTFPNSKATWYIANQVQEQVNTDNTFSIAKLRLIPFNQSLLPKNIKARFVNVGSSLPTQKVKYVKMTSSAPMRQANKRFLGYEQDPTKTLSQLKAIPWKYEVEPEGAIFVKEYPDQVNGQTVEWKSDWLIENNRMWNETKKGVRWNIASQFTTETYTKISLCRLSFNWGLGGANKENNDMGNTLANYPKLIIDGFAFNAPFQNSTGNVDGFKRGTEQIEKDKKNRPHQFNWYNHADISKYIAGSMGQIWDDAAFLSSGNRWWGEKIVCANPYFNIRSSFTTSGIWAYIGTGQIPEDATIFGGFFTFGATTWTSLTATGFSDAFLNGFTQTTSTTTPSIKERFESILQDRNIPYYSSPADKASSGFGNKGILRGIANYPTLYSALPASPLTSVKASNIEEFDGTNADDTKYIWMTKSVFYDGDKQVKNINYPTEKFGDIGYLATAADKNGDIDLTNNLKTTKWGETDFGDDDYVDAAPDQKRTNDYQWKQEDILGIAHHDYLTAIGVSGSFTSQNIRSWYERTDQWKKSPVNNLVEEIILDNATYLERMDLTYHTGEMIRLELFDENRKLIYSTQTSYQDANGNNITEDRILPTNANEISTSIVLL